MTEEYWLPPPVCEFHGYQGEVCLLFVEQKDMWKSNEQQASKDFRSGLSSRLTIAAVQTIVALLV